MQLGNWNIQLTNGHIFELYSIGVQERWNIRSTEILGALKY